MKSSGYLAQCLKTLIEGDLEHVDADVALLAIAETIRKYHASR